MPVRRNYDPKFKKMINDILTEKDRPDRAVALNRWLGRLARTLFKLTALMIVGILFSVFVVWLSNNFIIGFFALIIIVLFWVGKIFWDDSANSA